MLQAVDFAKHRGWKYVVEAPQFRKVRSDGATYQVNLFPNQSLDTPSKYHFIIVFIVVIVVAVVKELLFFF